MKVEIEVWSSLSGLGAFILLGGGGHKITSWGKGSGAEQREDPLEGAWERWAPKRSLAL